MRALKPMPRQIWLENYIANRILYPGALAIGAYDMQIDLAILTQVLKLNKPDPFINTTLRKLVIPQSFLDFVSDLPSLTLAFINGLLCNRPKKDLFEDLWTVTLSGEREDIVGSILSPRFTSPEGSIEINLNNKIFKFKAGSISCLPCPFERCAINFSASGGKMLGKNKSVVELYGGKLGLVIDGRLNQYENQ